MTTSPWPPPRSLNGGIDEIPLTGVPGRLWLCGKHVVGPDVEHVLHRLGAHAVVCLNEEFELADRYPAYVQWLRANTVAGAQQKALWHPIADLHAPPLDTATALVDILHDRLRAEHHLVVHCGAGIGRAGTVAAALLIRQGLTLDDALHTVATHRPMAGPEAGPQRELLEQLAEMHAMGQRHQR